MFWNTVILLHHSDGYWDSFQILFVAQEGALTLYTDNVI